MMMEGAAKRTSHREVKWSESLIAMSGYSSTHIYKAVAWTCDLAKGDPHRYIGVGFDSKGREIEVVAVRKDLETWVIIHAQHPAKIDIKRKLGLIGGNNDEKRR